MDVSLFPELAEKLALICGPMKGNERLSRKNGAGDFTAILNTRRLFAGELTRIGRGHFIALKAQR